MLLGERRLALFVETTVFERCSASPVESMSLIIDRGNDMEHASRSPETVVRIERRDLPTASSPNGGEDCSFPLRGKVRMGVWLHFENCLLIEEYSS